MSNPLPGPAGESAPEAIARMEREIAQFARELGWCEDAIRSLRAAENPREGKFLPRDIFERQQEKLRLGVEIDLRRARINRLRLTEMERAEYERVTRVQ